MKKIFHNIHKERYSFHRSLRLLVLLILGFLIPLQLLAEGSKDLYPSVADGGKGGRAHLLGSAAVTTNSLPFPTNGTHFVYAEAGEQIAMASSAQQQSTTARIRLYDPNGSQITLTFRTGSSFNYTYYGHIANRTAELAGPRLPGQAAGSNRYLPVYHQVTQTGIYRVEFIASSNNADHRNTYYNATANWSQTTTSAYIAAWDISVAKPSTGTIPWEWVEGRVYTNVLSMDNPSYGGTSGSDNNNFRPNSGFYGKFKVLTHDGYLYNVDNNGNQGIVFTFMVNNRGFYSSPTNREPIYSSIDAPNNATVQSRYHDPRSDDIECCITHKIFYNIPDPAMPETARKNGNDHWLKPVEKTLEVDEMSVEGADGVEMQISDKGGHVIFENYSGGDYIITIKPAENVTAEFDFEPRILTGRSDIGENRIYFDGKDGDGNPLPQGDIPVEVTLVLQGAEVHFPFIDMELNQNGIIIELLEENSGSWDVVSDRVYWNDVPIGNGGGNNGSKSNPPNAHHDVIPEGISSNSNGHIWGLNTNATRSTFGDEMGMDTWTFVRGDELKSTFEVTHRVADLYTEIVSHSVNDGEFGDEPSVVEIGDIINYIVMAGNREGSCPVEGVPFSFILPPGFIPVGADEEAQLSGILFNIDNTCGSEVEGSRHISYDPDTKQYTFHSKLNLNGECDGGGDDCKVTYSISAAITEDSDPSNSEAISTILRPKDVSDPDATNISNPANPVAPEGVIDLEQYYYPPTDPFFEVEHNGKEGVSNNIDYLPLNLIRVSDMAIVKESDKQEAIVGDDVEFILSITNYGPHKAVDVMVIDIVPDGFGNIRDITDGGSATANVIRWEIGDLDKDEEKQLKFKVTVLANGDYLNIANIFSDDDDLVDPDPDNNSSSKNPVNPNNYWIGGKAGAPNAWYEPDNWTGNYVPVHLEDIEFATEANNPTQTGNPNSGPAKEDLHLDKDRWIGDLINKSDKDLIITTENKLVIDGEVKDNNIGGIVVKADPDLATGTLLFANPEDNEDVTATVEFYNGAYECDDCGYFRKQWQYFGIPVDEANFPYQDPKIETVNQWVEPYGNDGNKWRPAPHFPDAKLKAFKGYEITSSTPNPPTHIYSFQGKLNLDDKEIVLSKTADVTYSGVHILANSYTAAIPISAEAINIDGGITMNNIYLFNRGTRDQWRKLNGDRISGVTGGQYTAVPLMLGGQADLPNQIPSMHSFLVRVLADDTKMTLKYDQLEKNVADADPANNQPAWRSATADSDVATNSRSGLNTNTTNESSAIASDQNSHIGSTSAEKYPYIIVDVIGEESADRVWLFAVNGTTYGFDNGWDGEKIIESDIVQLYVEGTDNSRFQVASIPQFSNIVLGLLADNEGEYNLEFKVSSSLAGRGLLLYDKVTGEQMVINEENSYRFRAEKGDNPGRFVLSEGATNNALSACELLIKVKVGNKGSIDIDNGCKNAVAAYIYDNQGKLLHQAELEGYQKSSITVNSKGVYIVRLQNADLSDLRKVMID